MICQSLHVCILFENIFVLTDEVDEIEVYGSEAQSGTQLATYSFEVINSKLFTALYVIADLCGM